MNSEIMARVPAEPGWRVIVALWNAPIEIATGAFVSVAPITAWAILAR